MTLTSTSKAMKELLNRIADLYEKRSYWNGDYIYQGMELDVDDRICVFDGGEFAPYKLSNHDVYVIYYRDIFFICTENYIMFFKEEMLASYLNGDLDEFWGLFPTDYAPIVYEEDIMTMEDYFVDKKALMDLSESLYEVIRKEKN